MKVSATAFLLLLSTAATSSIDDANIRTRGSGFESLDHNMMERKLQGKKGQMKGGKKGSMNDDNEEECTDDAIPIVSCSAEINESGRYILNNTLICGIEENGITVLADDVHLDCQDNQIRARFQPSLSYGIGVFGATHVTVSGCQVNGFEIGLISIFTDVSWTDLVIRNSTFNNNTFIGIRLEGVDPANPSIFTLVDSTVNGNGNDMQGFGVVALNAAGTIFATSMNNNHGMQESYGILASSSSDVTLIDVTANGNSRYGIFRQWSTAVVTVINSIACGNGLGDIYDVQTAQANTCNVSNSTEISNNNNNLPVCQCLC
jgi:hypothetical protein